MAALAGVVGAGDDETVGVGEKDVVAGHAGRDAETYPRLPVRIVVDIHSFDVSRDDFGVGLHVVAVRAYYEVLSQEYKRDADDKEAHQHHQGRGQEVPEVYAFHLSMGSLSSNL